MANSGRGNVLELALGFLVAGGLGARGAGLVAGGLGLGLVFYGVSCLIWDAWPCWWCQMLRPSAKRSVKKGPGKRRRRSRKCWRCGGSGLVDRWGTRLMNRG